MYIINESRAQEIENYVDVLDFSTSLSVEQKNKYIKILKDKYNYIYKEKYNDFEKIKNISLSNSFSKEDFSDYSNYVKYSLAFFKLKKYKSNFKNEYWNIISIKDLKKLVEKFPIDVEKGLNSNYLAYVNTNNIVIPEKTHIGVVIHELGHVVQYLTKYNDGVLTDIKNSPSEYATTNGGECFAENFCHYVLDLNYKKHFASCSKEFEKSVFKKYITLAKNIENLKRNNVHT